MNPDQTFDALPAPLAGALARRGFTSLTPVQQAVLGPDLAGRDLRISSQTGSGKTVAVGLALAPSLERALAERAAAPAPDGAPRATAAPAAVLIAPTRELAAQIASELGWLLAPLGARVACVTGGTSFGVEARALRREPLVIAGTPGRLLDHLERGTIDPRGVAALVLDEADQMLDLGFREELEAIVGRMPADRRTHLVSATFSREVRALADRFQQGAVSIEGTRPGAANGDIAHVAHLVLPAEREAAIVNLLLLAPGERTLVFVRTREGAAELADRLTALGLPAGALSGDLEQRERTRTLDAFRSGVITTLVATDVAARGIDVPEVGRVIHADPPGDPEIFTHRSGRTGRAGRKGTSVLLVAPFAREHALRLLRRAGVDAVFRPVPSPADVLRAADDRLAAELAACRGAQRAASGAVEGAESAGEGAERAGEGAPEARLKQLAARLLADMDATELVAALLARAKHTGPCAPQPVTVVAPPRADPSRARPPMRRGDSEHARPGMRRGDTEHARPGTRRGDTEHARPGMRRGDTEHAPRLPFVPFQVNWGERHGADPRRLLALVCRRGGVSSREIGAIRIGSTASVVEVASPAAPEFARAVNKPDARDARIRIVRATSMRLDSPGPGGDFAAPPREASRREAARPRFTEREYP
ncbi:DEAD/DEAH box helicase [Sorangium cellulosum]|uniref:DEAD/DEAH box helicase n=1 Tax=Sorangium cellulosum TaxID=56 RepID=A0A2L0F0J7_SORCE|nr:DEAD/DEAH box helicase [Sorangium cellulosum]AUX45082.1 DEAD/DEAH box helicase [Sorangium cellulosum]